METTINSFVAKDVRLQLIKISDDNEPNFFFEIRFNRKVVKRFKHWDIHYALLYYSRIISDIIIDRRSPLCQM